MIRYQKRGMPLKNKNNRESWIRRIQKGDEQVFEQLFKEFYFVLVRFAWRYVKSKAVAEELVQEVFADIWADKANWHPSGSVRSYLYQVVKNQSIDFIRHRQVRREYDPEWMAEKENPTINYEDPRRRKQIAEAIKREIGDLPPRSKMTFKLHRYDGLTYKEVAQVMDISVKTVESQMTWTLKRLRNRLSHLLPLLIMTVLLSAGH